MGIIRDISCGLKQALIGRYCLACHQTCEGVLNVCRWCLADIEMAAPRHNPADLPVKHNHWDDLYVGYRYRGVLQTLLARFKFHNDFCAGASLAVLLNYHISQIPEPRRNEVQGLISMPGSWQRTLKRGYNPAAWLGRQAARYFGWPDYSTLIHRSRHTAFQNRLALAQRLANPAGSFQLHRKGQRLIPHCTTLLLIDDILTTGSSLNHLSELLKEAGCRQLIAVTLAQRQKYH